MRKKGKLYIVDKWNQPAFMAQGNLFPEGGLFGAPSVATPAQLSPSALASAQALSNQQAMDNYLNSTNFLGIAKKDNPFSKVNLSQAFSKQGLGSALSAAAPGLISTGVGLVGGLANSAISGGLESGAGSAISGVGSTIGGAVGQANPIAGAAITLGSQVIGGLANRAFGSKLNEQKIAEVEAENAQLNQDANNMAGADKQSLLNTWGDVDLNSTFSQSDIGEDGWFSNKAEKKYEQLKRAQESAKKNAVLGFRTGLHNIETAEDTAVADNFIYASGGPLIKYPINQFSEGGDMYNELNDDLTPLASSTYQPIVTDLKKQNAGYNVDDYTYRVQQLHPEITREQVESLYNSTPYIGSDRKSGRTAGQFIDGTENNAGNRVMLYPNNLSTQVTNKNANDLLGDTITHETNHLYTDTLLGGKSTDEEKDLLWDAYSPFTFNTKSGDVEMHEERATNAGLRHRISQKYGNATGAELDKVIDGLPDNELSEMYFNQNGYMNKDGKKHFKAGAVKKALKLVAQNPVTSNIFMENMAPFGGPLFALGGDLQTNGTDWSDGLTHINAGLSHEMSPYDGVQVGRDTEGVPNLVEEGETIFDDYVYSNRILADETTKQMFRVPKKRDITYAEISKRLEKEAAERPNDPISQAGLKAQMHDLADQQERQKQEMEAERARAAFESLSPEEQVAIMQQRAAEEQAMMNQAAQEEAMAQQAAMQGQPSPEEIAMMQQQQMADGSQPNLGQQPQMNAYGGKINRFDWGGLKDLFGAANEAFSNSRGAGRLPWNTKMSREDVAKLEDVDNYKNWTQYVNDHWDDADVQDYLKTLDLRAGGNHLYVPNGDAIDKEKAKAYWNSARTDKKMGYYHYTPTWNEPAPEPGEAPKETMIHHALEDDDDYIEGELDPTVVGAETRREVLPNGDTVIYHDRAKAPEAPVEEPKAEAKEKQPKHKAEWLRYAGLFGPAVGLGMQLAGVGKPDYSRLDAAVESAGNAATADYKPIGNYLTYRPMDIWYEQNRMNANARATDRAIMNSGASQGAKMAGLLASGYNDQMASGDLYRKALEYNDAQREKVTGFNRDTDKYNSDQYGQTSRFNADALNRHRQYKAGLAMQAANERLNRDAGWYNSIYGNVGQLFKGISDLGRENAQYNQIANMGADGIFGNLGESYTGKTILEDKKNQSTKANGGKLKKKRRGFTF